MPALTVRIPMRPASSCAMRSIMCRTFAASSGTSISRNSFARLALKRILRNPDLPARRWCLGLRAMFCHMRRCANRSARQAPRCAAASFPTSMSTASMSTSGRRRRKGRSIIRRCRGCAIFIPVMFSRGKEFYAELLDARLADVDATLAYAKARGIDVDIVLMPVHATRLEVFRVGGLLPLFESWKQALARNIAAARSLPGGGTIRAFDFSPITELSQEDFPPPTPGNARASSSRRCIPALKSATRSSRGFWIARRPSTCPASACRCKTP